MLQEMKGTMYMLYANYKMSLLSFWAILVGIIVISIVTTYFFGAGNAEFTISAPMYFYTPIVAAMIVTGIMPFMIKQGVTRFPLFISLGTFILVASILNAIVIQIMIGILRLIFGSSGDGFVLKKGSSEFSMNHIAELFPNATILTEITIDVSITMLVSMVVFFITLIFYRYGKLIGFSFMGVVGILFVFDISNEGMVFKLFEKVVLNFDFNYFYYMFGISIIVFLLSYILMHKITIKK